jgi:hypothetical protein
VLRRAWLAGIGGPRDPGIQPLYLFHLLITRIRTNAVAAVPPLRDRRAVRFAPTERRGYSASFSIDA